MTEDVKRETSNMLLGVLHEDGTRNAQYVIRGS